MKKRTIALLLSLVLALGIITPAAAATSFTDVPADAWYATDVADVQKYGIIQGVGSNRFLPKGVLTYAQAVTMASRVYARLSGETIPDSGEYRFWYEPYLEYARDRELLDKRLEPSNFDMPCSRADMAWMFYRSIQGGDNAILNNVDQIPDLCQDDETIGIYSLYRFGILVGSDEYGSFYPDRSITRAETAAILNRVLDVNKRKSFTLKPGSVFHSLDFSCSWTNTCSFINYDFDGTEFEDDYYTTIAFQRDGKLYGIGYCLNSDNIGCFQGNYKLKGDTITITVSWDGSDKFSSTYRVEPTSYRWDPGFILTLVSGETFLEYDENNQWIFWKDEEHSATQCKDTCLELWGVESQ